MNQQWIHLLNKSLPFSRDRFCFCKGFLLETDVVIARFYVNMGIHYSVYSNLWHVLIWQSQQSKQKEWWLLTDTSHFRLLKSISMRNLAHESYFIGEEMTIHIGISTRGRGLMLSFHRKHSNLLVLITKLTLDIALEMQHQRQYFESILFWTMIIYVLRNPLVMCDVLRICSVIMCVDYIFTHERS